MEGKDVPAGARYAFVPNNLSPFSTAAQAGSARASLEVGVPIIFQAPTGPDYLSQQLSMLETFINDKYTGITFSAIDRHRARPHHQKGCG